MESGKSALAPAARSTEAPAPNGTTSPGGFAPSTAFERVLAVGRQRKWWIVQAVIIVPLVVGVISGRQEKQYTATASLLFRDPTATVLDASSSQDATRQAATNSSLVSLPAVAAQAATIAGPSYAGAEIAGAITVSPSSDSDVVQISATSPDPRRSAAMANAYGQAYIDFRTNIDRSQIQSAIRTVEDSLARLTPAQTAGGAGGTLQAQLGQLQLANSLAGGNAELVQRATPPTSPSSPRTRRNVVLAVILGLLLGVALAFLRDRLDQSLRTPEELEQLYRIPLLARIPKNRGIAHTPAGAIPTKEDPVATEAFRTLRANLRYFGVDERLRSVLVASPMSSDGKSTVAAHLAQTMAAMGDHVVLVEADMHKPSALGSYGSLPQVGLSTVLSGAPVDEAIHHVPVEASLNRDELRELAILPSGPVPPNPSELLESERMQALLYDLEERYDLVVIDSPALTQVSDTRALVRRVSGVIVVSAVNQTRRSSAIEFRKQMELLGGNALGVVANLAPVPRRAYQYGYATAK